MKHSFSRQWKSSPRRSQLHLLPSHSLDDEIHSYKRLTSLVRTYVLDDSAYTVALRHIQVKQWNSSKYFEGKPVTKCGSWYCWADASTLLLEAVHEQQTRKIIPIRQKQGVHHGLKSPSTSREKSMVTNEQRNSRKSWICSRPITRYESSSCKKNVEKLRVQRTRVWSLAFTRNFR